MKIRLSRESEVPLRRQLAEQIVFLIGAGELRPGERLPSVRELARRLKIHHNTVSEAYQDLVQRTWVERQPGSQLVVVGPPEPRPSSSPQDALDEVINNAMRRARDEGYSLAQLRDRVKRRLLAQQPDHILLVDREPAFREIMCHEIRQALDWPVRSCTKEELVALPALSENAQVATPEYNLHDVEPFLPKDRPPVSLTFSSADEPLDAIHRLRDPSVIAMISVSDALLQTASGMLASAVGRLHSYRDVLVMPNSEVDLRAVDLAICDSIAMSVAAGTRKVRYQLLHPKCLAYLGTAVGTSLTV
jgi:DNA-binding transcriptional regulator YhcF (GntR family)